MGRILATSNKHIPHRHIPINSCPQLYRHQICYSFSQDKHNLNLFPQSHIVSLKAQEFGDAKVQTSLIVKM
jgi:hypothetical protein